MTLTPLRTIAASILVLAVATPALAADLTLTPAPAKAVRAEGSFKLSAATRIHVAKGDIEARGVAAQLAGLFYGAMSLWQLATPDDAKGPVAIPAVAIEDAPRFAWRGLMVDSARHYQSIATLKVTLDAMAAHKLNTFHWHMVDGR